MSQLPIFLIVRWFCFIDTNLYNYIILLICVWTRLPGTMIQFDPNFLPQNKSKSEWPTQGFPRLPFWQFLPQNLVSDPKKLRARVLSDEYMISSNLYSFIYGFVVWCISDLISKNYQCFGSCFNLFKTTNPWIIIKDPFTPYRESLGPLFKSPEGKPCPHLWYSNFASNYLCFFVV